VEFRELPLLAINKTRRIIHILGGEEKNSFLEGREAISGDNATDNTELQYTMISYERNISSCAVCTKLPARSTHTDCSSGSHSVLGSADTFCSGYFKSLLII